MNLNQSIQQGHERQLIVLSQSANISIDTNFKIQLLDVPCEAGLNEAKC